MPVFSSLQITNWPCSYSTGDWTYRAQISLARCSKSGSWLLSQ